MNVIKSNGSSAYLERTNPSVGQNLNFYDFKPSVKDCWLILKNSWQPEFEKLIGPNVKGLSFVSDESADLSFLPLKLPHLEELILKAQSVIGVEVLFAMKHIKDISLTTEKNQKLSFTFNEGIKSFRIDWKKDFQIPPLPDSLEFFAIEKARDFDLKPLFSNQSKLLKFHGMDSNFIDGTDDLLTLGALRHLEFFHCRGVHFKQSGPINTTLKYLNLSQVKIGDLEWIKRLQGLDILILDNCGEIPSLKILSEVPSLRGLWIANNTKISDGDMSFLKEIPNLQNLFLREFANYTHKSTGSWSWNKFGKTPKEPLFERKK